MQGKIVHSATLAATSLAAGNASHYQLDSKSEASSLRSAVHAADKDEGVRFMKKILLASSVFALAIGVASAQTTGTVTPSAGMGTQTPSTTTSTPTGTTSTPQGTTSTPTGTTSTPQGTTSTAPGTGATGSMGTLQTTTPGSSTTNSTSPGSVTGSSSSSGIGTTSTVAPCTPSNSG